MGTNFAGRHEFRTTCVFIIMLAAAACEQPNVTEVALPTLQVGDIAHEVEASLPYQAGAYAERITERGGVVNFGIGELVVPPGAVDREITIVARVDGRSISVTLEPAGLKFPAAAQPVLRFSVPRATVKPRIYYVTFNNVITEILPAKLNSQSSLETRLSHFSKYIFGVE